MADETNFDLDHIKRVPAYEPEGAPNVVIGTCPECGEAVRQRQDFLVLEAGGHAHTLCEKPYFQ